MNILAALALSLTPYNTPAAIEGITLDLARPQATTTLNSAPVTGAKSRYSLLIETTVQGLAVSITGKYTLKTSEPKDGIVRDLLELSDTTVDVGGSDPGVPAINGELLYKADTRVPTGLSGGFQGTDEARMLALVYFIPPSKPVASGDSYTIEVPEVADKIPAYKFEGKYEGEVEIEGVKAHKVTAKIAEKAAEGFRSTTTFFLTTEGKVVNATAKFTEMPVPAVGAKIDGTFKIKRLTDSVLRLEKKVRK